MANISRLLELASGVVTGVNLPANTLEIGPLQMDGTTGNFTQMASATTTSYSVIWPAAQGTANQVLAQSGTPGTLAWVTQTAGANTSLSNLATTSINANMIPNGNETYSLGSLSDFWGPSFIQDLRDANDARSMDPINRQLVDTAGNAQVAWSTSGATLLSLLLSGSTSGTLTHNAAATTASYGLTWPAAQASGTQFLQNDGSGVLSWASPTGGANTALSNLTTTSINEDLLPNATVTRVIGSSSLVWSAAWIKELLYPSFMDIRLDQEKIYNHTGSPAIDVGATNLNDNSSILSVDWTNRLLADTAGTTQLSWSTSGIAFSQATASTVPYLNASKILTSSAVTPTELGYLSGVTSAIQTQFGGKLSLTGGTMSGDIDMGGGRIHNVSDPSSAGDVATKNYVDNLVNGLTWQGPAKAYANSNVALTGGATLTIDGYSVQNGDLVLLGAQTTASQNGEYLASGVGTAYVLTANGLPTVAGDAWLILNGTNFSNSAFVATAAVPAATFTQFAGPNSLAFSAPLSLSGNTVSLAIGNGLTTASSTLVTHVDGATLDFTSGAMEVKAGGIGSTQLATGAFDQSTIVGGAGTAASVARSPNITTTETAGTTFTGGSGAAGLFAVRYEISADSGTAGQMYKADNTTANSYIVIGLSYVTSTITAGNPITVVEDGIINVPSHGFTVGMPVYLGTSGAVTSTAPSAAGTTVVIVGIVKDANNIWARTQILATN